MPDATGGAGKQPAFVQGSYGLGLAGESQDPWPEHASRWLRERMDRLKANPKFTCALRTLLSQSRPRLKDFALDRNVFDLFAYLACMAVGPRGASRKSWEKLWAVETGKTWKALKEFPVRLENMANEVKRVNKSHFFAPTAYIRKDTVQARIVQKRFEQLPGIIQVYAEALRRQLNRIPVLTAKTFPPPPRGLPMEIAWLSRFAEAFTGRPHDTEVAALLNCAALALGESRQFDTLNIAKYRSRRRQAKNQLFYGEVQKLGDLT